MGHERIRARIDELTQLEEELFGKLNMVRGMRIAFLEVLDEYAGSSSDIAPEALLVSPVGAGDEELSEGDGGQ